MDLLTDIRPSPALAPHAVAQSPLPRGLAAGAGGRRSVSRPAVLARQRTLKEAIGCVGVGLHGGREVALTLHPAAPGTGIRFRRGDLGVEIPARFDAVADTRLCTELAAADRPEVTIGTIEHVMAALAGCGIDNVVVEVDGPEIPILDGSAAPFVFLIDCAGVVTQEAPRRVIEILRPVEVRAGDAFARLLPRDPELLPRDPEGAEAAGELDMALSIAFDAPAIGRQSLSLRLTEGSFRQELAHARTFTLATEIESLRASGRARGGSLENAVVVDGAHVLNPGGLRAPDEFVRHKLLDAVGDLALAGAVLRGRFIAHCSGHALNNRLLRALFANADAWREIAPAASARLSAAA
ncbi:MAG: UDP-3-O-acyl-N-acetylglucosamine deacetylase [Acidibrevibacterium sp.]|uniref:UDP-3-O-acyl-N-acetylglucosamine deacetylase n=1 Tax=Acidibrevibacterium sp. TaxID=2606776 RepID=UPI003CFD73C2